MKMESLAWTILFLPLAAAGLIAVFTSRNRRLSAGISIGAVVAAFILAVIFAATRGWGAAPIESSFSWLAVGDFQVDFGLRVDTLSVLMILLVTGVAAVIHIYSWQYMRGDPGYSRYFGCLSLFTFSMLGIVLSANFVQLFIFWELVGVSSYLLIGFWFEKPSAADAGKKAFIVNRLGDFGFIIGIILVWAAFKTLNFGELKLRLAADPRALGGLTTTAGMLIFCGAAGKSAQFPLHVWLPDAMEGPTPVSALIHAATMVAAGVYMLARVFFLLNLPVSHALGFIACVGGFTALLTAVIAVQQDDIKRILAYSTLSQLGYMVMAIGLHGPSQAMFHLSTHAFFKALLFLGAGSVIVAMHHEQNIWKMGALGRRMPITRWCFLFGTLALAGIPPFSGFYSKDGILALAWNMPNPFNKILFVALTAGVAGLTAFYMFRLVFVVFFGSPKSPGAEEAPESPAVMLWPLRLLAILSLIGGILGLEGLYMSHFAGSSGTQSHSIWQQLVLPFEEAPGAAILGLLISGAGIAAAYALYARAQTDPLPTKLGALSAAIRDKFYFDELYTAVFVRAHDSLAAIASWIDRWIIAGLAVRGAHGATELVGRALRRLQTGNLQTYAFFFALGVALLLYFVLK
jgi:NADH-quinone oxidoreductase subunit L